MNQSSAKIIKIGIYFIWILIAICGVFDSFKEPANIIPWVGDIILLMVLYFKFKSIPLYFHPILAFVALFNIFGENLFAFFYSISYYDKILHLVDSFIYCIVVYFITKPKIENKKICVLFCIFAVLSYGVLWEIYEYSADNILGTTTQGVYTGTMAASIFYKVGAKEIVSPIVDTMQDFIYNLIGTLIFGFIILIYETRIKNYLRR